MCYTEKGLNPGRYEEMRTGVRFAFTPRNQGMSHDSRKELGIMDNKLYAIQCDKPELEKPQESVQRQTTPLGSCPLGNERGLDTLSNQSPV